MRRPAIVPIWQTALARRQPTLRAQIVALSEWDHGGTAIARALGIPRDVAAWHLRAHREARGEKPFVSRRWARRLEKARAA